MDTAHQAFLSFTISQSLLKFLSIDSVMLSNHLILCHSLLLLLSIFTTTKVFSNELALPIKWPKHWSFSFSIRPSSDYSGLVSFRINWFDLHAVQGTLKSLLQHHNLRASIFWHSAFFMIQLSCPYMTTGKIIALTIQTFVSTVMSLLFNMLSIFFPQGHKELDMTEVTEHAHTHTYLLSLDCKNHTFKLTEFC